MDALLLLVHVVDEAQPQQIIEGRLELARIALEARQLTSAAEFAMRVGRPNRTVARVVGECDPTGSYHDVLLASDSSDALAELIRMTQQLIEQLLHSLRWSAHWPTYW